MDSMAHSFKASQEPMLRDSPWLDGGAAHLFMATQVPAIGEPAWPKEARKMLKASQDPAKGKAWPFKGPAIY